ncbi:MAG: GNAT family N-acetyltransferase [Chloroflexota bacterium]
MAICTTEPPALLAGAAVASPAQTLFVHEVSSEEDFVALRLDWEDLLGRTADASPYRAWGWLVSWWDAYHTAKNRLSILTVRDGDGRLQAVAPLMRTNLRPLLPFTILECLGGRYTGGSDRLGFLLAEGREAELAALLLVHLAGQRARWQVLDLRSVPANNAAWLGEGARRAGLTMAEAERQLAPYARIERSEAAQFRALRRSMRSYVRRYQNHVAERGGAVYRHLSGADAKTYLPRIFDLHLERRANKSFWQGRQEKLFLALAFPRLIAERQLSVHVLELNGRTIAGMVCLDDADKRAPVLTGFDPACSMLSPVSQLTWETILHAGRHGQRSLHFGTPDLPHKRRWGKDADGEAICRYLIYHHSPTSRLLQAVLRLGHLARYRVGRAMGGSPLLLRLRPHLEGLLPLS